MADQPNLNTQAIISQQAAGGGASASGNPATMASMCQDIMEFGGELMSFIQENLDKVLSFLEGVMSKGIVEAIDQGSMATAIIGKPPENCMVKDSPGMSGQFAPPEGPAGNVMNTTQNLVSAGGGKGH